MKKIAHNYKKILQIIIFAIICGNSKGQSSIFNGLKKNENLAKYYISKGDYHEAIKIYQFLALKENNAISNLKIAKLYNKINEPGKTARYIEKHLQDSTLNKNDMMLYINALKQNGELITTKEYLDKYLKKYPNDENGIKVLFSLKNIKYYYEDSKHYKVDILDINTTKPDFYPSFAQNKLHFSSQRSSFNVIKNLDMTTYAEQSKLFTYNYLVDSLDVNHNYNFKFSKIESKKPFKTKGFWKARYYNNGKSVAITMQYNNDTKNEQTLGIFFSDFKESTKKWTFLRPFPYNGFNYVLMDPAFSKDETIMYFSSDMEGSIGGYDIFMSKKNEGATWSKPINMGEKINTIENEISPFLFSNDLDLYFSSNGHAGLGGYDVFMTRVYENLTLQPKNIGYPINSNMNESGFILNERGNIGFFNSNRKNNGFDEDIYHLKYDLKAYPMMAKMKIEVKNNTLDNKKKIYKDILIELIDYYSKTKISSKKIKNLKGFGLKIPYSSKYLLSFSGENLGVTTAVLEFPMFNNSREIYYITIYPRYRMEEKL